MVLIGFTVTPQHGEKGSQIWCGVVVGFLGGARFGGGGAVGVGGAKLGLAGSGSERRGAA